MGAPKNLKVALKADWVRLKNRTRYLWVETKGLFGIKKTKLVEDSFKANDLLQGDTRLRTVHPVSRTPGM